MILTVISDEYESNHIIIVTFVVFFITLPVQILDRVLESLGQAICVYILV